MSGTSLDGIDIVLCELTGHYDKTQIKVSMSKTYDMPESIKQHILDAIELKTNVKDITSLNFELGYLFANCVIQFLKDNNLDKNDIAFIASHGQTLYHIPKDEPNHLRSTLQLGDGSIIANQCGIDTVYNFRTADMALGGQGAPLVPYADYVLFKSNDKTRTLHNLGGISNLTLLHKSKDIESTTAFDTGPANMMIDYAMQSLYGLPYDASGAVAKKGRLIKPLLDMLMAIPFIKELPPKSTGREMFGNTFTKEILGLFQKEKKEDLIHTLTEYTIASIVFAYKNLIKITVDEVIFSGGGAKNSYMMARLKDALAPTKVMRLEDLGFDSKLKEAVAFVILGNETLLRQSSNIKNATGSKKHAILGQICLAYKGDAS